MEIGRRRVFPMGCDGEYRRERWSDRWEASNGPGSVGRVSPVRLWSTTGAGTVLPRAVSGRAAPLDACQTGWGLPSRVRRLIDRALVRSPSEASVRLVRSLVSVGSSSTVAKRCSSLRSFRATRGSDDADDRLHEQHDQQHPRNDETRDRAGQEQITALAEAGGELFL